MKKCARECPLLAESLEARANAEYAARQAIAAETYLELHPNANPRRRHTKKAIADLALTVDPVGTVDDMLSEHATEEDEELLCPGPQKLREDGVRKVICGSSERQARLLNILATEVELRRLEITGQFEP